MSAFKSDFIATLSERGYIHQATDLAALDALAAKERLVAYVGYDATGDSLHVGHMVSIMMLRRMQQSGHRPIVLMGGGTTKVGDPSGKDEGRRLLSDEEIAGNIAAIKRSFEGYIDFSASGALLVNNADWLDTLQYIPFLRDVGRHFTINRMLTFDSVKLRLEREQPLTFLEFNYMILQAYDFLELFRRHGCRLQMGGSDQWGNIVNGVELARRIAGAELFGLTCPLITTASGAKMGKTAAGAVWLSPERLSDFDYWQYWRNTEDADVGRFLKLFTDLPLPEIARLEKLAGQEVNEAKKILATEATALCRGRAAAERAAETARQTFEEGQTPEDLPTVIIPRSWLAEGIPVYRLFFQAGMTSTASEARRIILQLGARANNDVVTDPNSPITEAQLKDGYIKLSVGKKRHKLVRPE